MHKGSVIRRKMWTDFWCGILYKMEKTRGDKHAGLVLINDSQGLSEWSKRGFTEPKSYKNLFFFS